MLAALTANLIFGFSFVFSKMALSVAHPLIILAVRFTVAFLTLNLLMLTGAVRIRLRGKKLGRLIAMGVAQPLLYFLLELYGLSLVSSALSGIIIALVPVTVLLLSTVFLHEKPTGVQVVCTVVSVAGVAAVSALSDDGGRNHLSGVLLLCGAVLTAAAFNILSRGESASFSPFERTYMMFLIGCTGFTALAAAVLRERFLPELARAAAVPRFWLAIFYLAVVSSVAAFLLYNYSTSVISAVRSSSFSNIITVVSVLAGVFILREKFSLPELLLCLPILGGVWGVNRTAAAGDEKGGAS